jgi:hypothetical protein
MTQDQMADYAADLEHVLEQKIQQRTWGRVRHLSVANGLRGWAQSQLHCLEPLQPGLTPTRHSPRKDYFGNRRRHSHVR